MSTWAMRSPIQRMTGTAIELPKALYLGPSGAFVLPRDRSGLNAAAN
jgi:hypothetical protein